MTRLSVARAVRLCPRGLVTLSGLGHLCDLIVEWPLELRPAGG
jgi:hypothetical protein